MMQSKYNYGDVVSVKRSVTFWLNVPGNRIAGPRVGERASVYAITNERLVGRQSKFPSGVIYSVEFENGDAIEVHEDDLELVLAAT